MVPAAAAPGGSESGGVGKGAGGAVGGREAGGAHIGVHADDHAGRRCLPAQAPARRPTSRPAGPNMAHRVQCAACPRFLLPSAGGRGVEGVAPCAWGGTVGGKVGAEAGAAPRGVVLRVDACAAYSVSTAVL